MEKTNYLFSLKMEQTELTIGGDKEFVESYLEKWLPIFEGKIPSNLIKEGVDNSSSSGENIPPASPPSRSTKMSLPDFIKLKAPKNYNDLLLTTFFYYERYEGLENVGVQPSMVMSFVNKLPNHPDEEEVNNILDKLIEDGFLQVYPGTEDNPKYQVTFSGEQCVKQGFETE